MAIIFLFSIQIYAQVLSPESLGIKITHSIECSSVKDQYISSTCWSFASNSFMESELLKQGLKIDLSEMYLARYSYLNKIYQSLSQKGKSYFTPGGQFHDVLKVINQYGIVPEEAYPGKPGGELNFDHTKLDTLMAQFTRKLLAEGKAVPSQKDLMYINETLDKYLGKVPASFLYAKKEYTPKTFAKNVLHFKAGDYIEITSYTHHPYYAAFVLEDKYNWSFDKYYNVPLNEFCAITDTALKNNYSVCWDGDISEEGFQYQDGIAWLKDTITDYKLYRQKSYEDKTSGIDHMMHIVGTAKDSKNKKWYLVKNSWGNYTNEENGYMFMQDDYFKIKTMAIIVNKNAIPFFIRKKLNL